MVFEQQVVAVALFGFHFRWHHFDCWLCVIQLNFLYVEFGRRRIVWLGGLREDRCRRGRCLGRSLIGCFVDWHSRCRWCWVVNSDWFRSDFFELAAKVFDKGSMHHTDTAVVYWWRFILNYRGILCRGLFILRRDDLHAFILAQCVLWDSRLISLIIFFFCHAVALLLNWLLDNWDILLLIRDILLHIQRFWLRRYILMHGRWLNLLAFRFWWAWAALPYELAWLP